MMAKKGEKISEETKAKMRAAALGEKNHMFGKKMTDEHKKKIGQSNIGKHNFWLGKKQTPEMIAKRVEKIKLPCSEEKKAKISKSNTGKKRTKAQCEALSKRTAERYKCGWHNGRGKFGYFFSKKMNKEVFYRSSYELIAYKILEQDKTVCSFYAESFRIPYIWNGKTHQYIPDIKSIGTNGKISVIEVKAEWQLLNERVMLKMAAAKLFCLENGYNFYVWTEKELLNAQCL